MMMKIVRKIPGNRERKKQPKVNTPTATFNKNLSCENVSYMTISYLQSIGVPTDNLVDPVKVRFVGIGEFVIMKNG